MGLINCRECSKEVSEQATLCPNCGIKYPSKKRNTNRFLVKTILSGLFLSLIGYGYYSYTNISNSSPTNSLSKKLNSSIPVKEQIIEKDDQEIVGEMLDSGKSVWKISRETGLRRYEIRKIKKAKKAASEEE